jgi:hypothetical protein
MDYDEGLHVGSPHLPGAIILLSMIGRGRLLSKINHCLYSCSLSDKASYMKKWFSTCLVENTSDESIRCYMGMGKCTLKLRSAKMVKFLNMVQQVPTLTP